MSGISEDARERAVQLQQELGWEEFAQPTADQLLAFLRRCEDEEGLDLAQKMLDSWQQAHECWLLNHRRQLAYLSSVIRDYDADTASRTLT